jgi:hypothetical protein
MNPKPEDPISESAKNSPEQEESGSGIVNAVFTNNGDKPIEGHININNGKEINHNSNFEKPEMNGVLKPDVGGDTKEGDSKREASSVRLEKLMGHGRFQQFQIWVFAALVRGPP